jgi:hypothetical protein
VQDIFIVDKVVVLPTLRGSDRKWNIRQNCWFEDTLSAHQGNSFPLKLESLDQLFPLQHFARHLYLFCEPLKRSKANLSVVGSH